MTLKTLLDTLDQFVAAERDDAQEKPAATNIGGVHVRRTAALDKLQRAIDELRDAGGACGPFRRIMVAVDGTEPSKWAVDLAGRLVGGLGGRVALLHVFPDLPGVAPEFVAVCPDLYEARRDASLELLRGAQAALPAGVQCELKVLEGEAARQIVEAARAWDADLVILGTHGRGPVAHFLLGSTAEWVVRHAHCPVLSVGHAPANAHAAHDVPAAVRATVPTTQFAAVNATTVTSAVARPAETGGCKGGRSPNCTCRREPAAIATVSMQTE